MAFLLILVADILVYALYLSPVAFDYLPLRIAPYIRVVFFMLNFRYCDETEFYFIIIFFPYELSMSLFVSVCLELDFKKHGHAHCDLADVCLVIYTSQGTLK